ncbi:unnamed protein product [Ceutorhynchus assimilis]|uniref:Nicastrin n=1 Tax=Ceutorhynchus assimilis TaxID=467358 RepID=A0A9N9QLJ9_9CUCU|nr:unnamed protein product [Ceutorhynchus assimilis]
MLNKVFFALLLVYTSSYILESNADRLKDQMYIKINGSVACYRRMNSTHQIGCSSNRGGSIGIIHYCDTSQDLDFILKNGSAGQYIPVIPTSLFSLDVMTELISNKHKIAGLILHPTEKPDKFSHDTQCPNSRYSVDGTCSSKSSWNPWGTGLLFADIPFPMFFTENQEQVQIIKQCFQNFNNFSYSTQGDRSLCSLELSAFMYATTSTPTCRRRNNIITNLNPVKLCDPLGDSNVWGSLFPLVEQQEANNQNAKPINDYKYIVVAARMDTTSLFEKTSGAESPITGVVTLLSIAKLLKQMLPDNVSGVRKNVLFILFNGETYDYIGSQRLLYDMERGHFPTDLPINNDILPTIYPENITLFIELSQLAPGRATYAHYIANSELINKFVQSLSENNPSNLPVNSVPNSLPPSSLHTFIRGNSSIKGLVLTNHEKEYRNHYYNSLYDNASNIEFVYMNGSNIPHNSIQKYVGDVATMVAKSIYQELMGQNYTDLAVLNLTLVDEMFHCYLEDPNCKLHMAVQKGRLPKSPLSLYVGVSVVDNFFTTLVTRTLAWFTGDPVAPSGPNCTNLVGNHVFVYYNLSHSLDRLDDMWCYRATVNMTEAVSPAFIIEDYDWSSNKYSSWSESTWNDMGMRMFLTPSSAHQKVTITLGSIVMIFSFIIVYFMKSKSHVLFNLPVREDPPANC